jgi:hypothetical protein
MHRFVTVGLLASLLLTPQALAGGPPTESERGFPLHTLDSAPAETTEVLAWYHQDFKIVPNLGRISG